MFQNENNVPCISGYYFNTYNVPFKEQTAQHPYAVLNLFNPDACRWSTDDKTTNGYSYTRVGA